MKTRLNGDPIIWKPPDLKSVKRRSAWTTMARVTKRRRLLLLKTVQV